MFSSPHRIEYNMPEQSGHFHLPPSHLQVLKTFSEHYIAGRSP
jgi:hypothetical protein